MRQKRPEESVMHNPDGGGGGDFGNDDEKKERAQMFVSLLRTNYGVVIPWLKNSLIANSDNVGSNTFFDLDEGKKKRVKNLFEIIRDSVAFLTEGEQKQHLAHDVNNKILKNLMTYMSVVNEDFIQGTVKNSDMSRRLLKIFYSLLNRWYVSVEDLLLRAVDGKKISIENVVPMDLDKMFDVLNQFRDEGIGRIEVDEQEKVEKGVLKSDKRQYSHLHEKNFFIEFSEEEIKKQLAGRKVLGNDGLIDNLLLNMSRNGLKDQMGAKNVYLDVFVEGDELVLRVMDDGKGISKEFIDPINPECIFNQGVSGTGSTGLGLTDINTRVPSVGGELRLASQRDFKNYVTTFSTGQVIAEDYLEKINQNRSADKKVKTVFEIRLKIKN